MRAALQFYQHSRAHASLGEFLRNPAVRRRETAGSPLIRIIAFCLMPTHIHLFLEQMADEGISEYMRRVMGSYAAFFNTRAERKGPLWESRFKARLVETDEYAWHLSRYIHLNPVTAGLVKRPDEWGFSSYREYLGIKGMETLCDFNKVIPATPDIYRKFSEDQMDYQRSLRYLQPLCFD